ncbi:ankyrin repeat and SOCS box protein 5 isoform X2 [Sardina pilchardus]|uniref:ankyrin repeat and SOCS box protein 5 isoform X2 n=1 Tax=Sardina pilchardus TaxID=27697 RepID=UPI002E151806
MRLVFGSSAENSKKENTILAVKGEIVWGWLSSQGSWVDRTALHDAAYQGRLLNLKTLISQGHNVNALTIDRVSPLHEACIGSHVSCARALIDAGANVNVTTIDGVTPLLNSVIVGSVGCAESLLESGARPQALATCQPSPLHEACSRGHLKCVEALITWGADVDMDLPASGTPLYTSCRTRHPQCAKRLLDAGADVQLGTAMDTPLHMAAERDCTELVQLLLEFGADANVRNMEFKRAVEAAPPGSLTEGFLLVYEATPRILSHLCRQRIRECVGRQRLHLLPSLPLPKALRNFVCFR